MSDLGITSLSVSEKEIIMKTNEFGTIKTILSVEQEEDDDNVLKDDNNTSSSKLAINNKKKRPFLTKQSIKMAKNLYILLVNIEKLPNNPPMMNPLKIEKAEDYIQLLLEKLEKKTKEEFENEIETDKNFLKIEYTNENEDKIDEKDIISEVDLLKINESSSFEQIKEETIKTLVSELVRVYDKVVQKYIDEEIKRRKNF